MSDDVHTSEQEPLNLEQARRVFKHFEGPIRDLPAAKWNNE